MTVLRSLLIAAVVAARMPPPPGAVSSWTVFNSFNSVGPLQRDRDLGVRAGDHIDNDHGDWADAQVACDP
jgi:hypothetical protein